MIALGVCYSILGILVGSVFALLFINFDKTWKKILSFLFGTCGAGGFIVGLNSYFNVQSTSEKLWGTTLLVAMILVSFSGVMVLVCHLIKDEKDKNVLRIRDILLGQKSYIDKYYENRKQEIDKKLNIVVLQEREKNLIHREEILKSKEKFLEQEEERIKSLGNKKVKLPLPENRNIVVTNQFITLLPSYTKDLVRCVRIIDEYTDQFISENKSITASEFRGYLISISVNISNELFGGNSQIRIHFRKYEQESGCFERLFAIIGNCISNRSLTPIPFKGSMIERSYACKCALIKSINADYDFASRNSREWKDYMTYTFHRIKKDDIPSLSFGISVKNEERFKNQFYFLNFFKLEECLEDNLEKLDNYYGVNDVLYGREVIE